MCSLLVLYPVFWHFGHPANVVVPLTKNPEDSGDKMEVRREVSELGDLTAAHQ